MMIIPQGDELISRLRIRKYGGGKYSIRYLSYVTGKYKCISVKKSGVFSSREAATEWAQINLREYLVKEIQLLERQDWRSNAKIVQLFNSYTEQKKENQPRSAQQDLSMLANYGIPFFVSEMKEHDPNTWGEHGDELLDWLKKSARTRKNMLLTVSSANKVVNALNHFMKWLKRKKHIEHANYRQFEAFDQRKLNRRTEKNLVTDEVFSFVHKFLLSQKDGKVYADLWLLQRRCGFRVNEALGLMFHWLNDICPDFIKDDFVVRGFKVYGSLYLESQPARPYIRRVDGVIERAALKWRDCISPDNARTVPVVDDDVWSMLVDRYEEQCEAWDVRRFGPYKDSYLLFDGAQRNKYLALIAESYAELGIKSDGSHILRHTLSTEWSIKKLDDKTKELVLGHKEDARKNYDHFAGKINAERIKAEPMKRFFSVIWSEE